MKIPKLEEMDLIINSENKMECQFDNDPLLNSILENMSSVFINLKYLYN